MKDKLNVQSFETFGSVDGPGIRTVIFTKDCPLRCAYCHNPETWATKTSNYISNDEIVKIVMKYKDFNNGGAVTVSGGEPLLQVDALIDLFKKLKAVGANTCIDTSGYVSVSNKLEELLKYTDLVLLDIKVIDNDKHVFLTTKSNEQILNFAKFLSEHHQKTWIRHVLVPGFNDDIEDLTKLKDFVLTLNCVDKIELLPYHNMAISKYENLAIEYRMKDTKIPTKNEIQIAKKILGID